MIIIVQTPGATPPAAPTVSVAASITGDSTPGATLTGSASFTGTGLVVTYSWRKNGTQDGTSSTYSNSFPWTATGAFGLKGSLPVTTRVSPSITRAGPLSAHQMPMRAHRVTCASFLVPQR